MAASASREVTDTNKLSPNSDNTNVEHNVPSGVYQSVHALKTRINMPAVHSDEDFDEHINVGSKCCRPRKCWPRQDDFIVKPKDHRLIDTPYVLQRNTNVHSMKEETQLTNQMIADRTGTYSAFRDHSRFGSHRAIFCSVNGCMECYYGNACYSYVNPPIGYHGDVGSANPHRFSQMQYFPVQLPWQRYENLNVDRCEELRFLEPNGKCKARTSEPGPVIIKCFSLCGKDYEKKSFFKEKDHSILEKDKKQTTLTTGQSPMSIENSRHASKSKLGDQTTLIMGNGHRGEGKVPKVKVSARFKADRDPQDMKLPCHQKVTQYYDDAVNLSGQGSDNQSYETKQHFSSLRNQENNTERDGNVYEMYHSKYYRNNANMIHNGDHNTAISLKTEQDAKSDNIPDDNEDKVRRDQHDEDDVTVFDTINIKKDKESNNDEAVPDHVSEVINSETPGSSTGKQSHEESLDEGSALKEHGSKASRNGSALPSDQPDVEAAQNRNSLSESGRLGSSSSQDTIILNHLQFCGDEMSTCREPDIQECADSLKESKVPRQAFPFAKLTSENDSTQFSPNTQEVSGNRCASFLTRDEDNTSLNGHNVHVNFHGIEVLKRRNSKDVIPVATTMSQSKESYDRTSAEKSFYTASEPDTAYFQRRNTSQISSPGQKRVRHKSVDKDNEHYDQSQSDAMFFWKESQAHLSHSTSAIGCSKDVVEQNSVDPCSPESLSSDSWEKMNQEMYQGTLQNSPRIKSYICEHCGREFSHVSSLNNHIRRHTGLKPFRCRFCGKRFAQSGVLTAHLRTHTGDKPFECVICKKRFAQTTTLANHIRTHTGHKPFSCRYCKRKFAQSSTRNKHELSHTKEKPYVCKYCGRTFAQSATVTRHMRIHMRDDGFLCVYCGKEFPYLYALDKHLDSHSR